MSQKLDAADSVVVKESLVKNLLGGNADGGVRQSQPKKNLIAEVDSTTGETIPVQSAPQKSLITPLVQPLPSAPSASTPAPPPPVDEGPSMLELMMEAQRAALEEKKTVQEKEQKQAAKSGFGGFKKGFFGEKPKKTTASKPETSKTEKTEIVEVKKSSGSAAAKNAPKPNKEQIVEEVQRAMEEDQNPLLKQLRSNEWVTQDLMSMISTNSVLSQGLKNPRCVAAMELLQRDPKEAQKRYQGDPEVGQFLTEFCKIMSIHFTALGEQQSKGSATEEAPSKPVIEEIGPLQAKALAKQKELSSSSSSSTSMTKSSAAISTASGRGAAEESEEEKVQRVRTSTICPQLKLRP